MKTPARPPSFLRRLWNALPDVTAWALPPGPEPVPRLGAGARLAENAPPAAAPRPAPRIEAEVRGRRHRRLFVGGKVIDL